MGNHDAVTDAISNRINELYAFNVSMIRPKVDLNILESRYSSLVPPTCPDHGVWDWTVRIEYKMHEVGTSFYVLIFLGEVPENPEDWHTSPSFAGSAFAFVNKAAKRCANCTNNRDIVLEEFVHIDNAIASLSELRSLEPDVVEPYLTKALKWKVLKVLVYYLFLDACSFYLSIQSNGEPVELKSLEVSVLAVPLSYPPGAKFPVPGEPRLCNGITQGRPGGSGPV